MDYFERTTRDAAAGLFSMAAYDLASGLSLLYAYQEQPVDGEAAAALLAGAVALMERTGWTCERAADALGNPSNVKTGSEWFTAASGASGALAVMAAGESGKATDDHEKT